MKRRRLGKEARPQTEELWAGFEEEDAWEGGPAPNLLKRGLLQRKGWKCFGKEVQ